MRDPPKPIANASGSVLITPVAHLIVPHHLFPAAHCRCLGGYSQSEMMEIQAPDVLGIFLHHYWCWRCLTLCATDWDTKREVENSLASPGVWCFMCFAYSFPFTLLPDLPLSITCCLFIPDCDMDFTTGAGQTFGQVFLFFFFFLNVVCCFWSHFCGGSFFLLSLSVIFSVPNQFYLPLP